MAAMTAAVGAAAAALLAAGCPPALQPLCDSTCIAANCSAEMKQCTHDVACAASLVRSTACLAEHANDTQAAYYCLVPDDPVRDAFLHCAMDQHSCIPLKPADPYPHCNTSVVGPAAAPGAFSGVWWKPYAWKLGEPIECAACNTETLTGSAAAGDLLMVTNYTTPDARGRVWPMTVVTHMSPAPEKGPGTYLNVGTTYGLAVHEYHNIVYDGSNDAEPILVDYICGETLQGPYTTAFVLSKAKQLSAAAQRRANDALHGIGLDLESFCVVDNSCPAL